MKYYISYVPYGGSKRTISINVHDNIWKAKREAKQLEACGHTYIEIRTDLSEQYEKIYNDIA